MSSSVIYISLILVLASAWMIFSVLTGKQIVIRPRDGKHEPVVIQTFCLGAIAAAVIFLITEHITIAEVWHTLVGDSHLSPIGILILFLSMAYISIFLDYCGFFSFCAECAVRRAGSSQMKLFVILYATVSVLTVFTSNDIIILTFTPFIYYFTGRRKINPMPYLIAEFFAANTWSMTLYIGNPTNILLSDAFGISFCEYLSVMWLPALTAGTVNFAMVSILFRKSLSVRMEQTAAEDKPKLKDLHGTIAGLIILVSCIAGLCLAQVMCLQTWVIALSFAVLLFVFVSARMLYNFIRCRRSGKPFKNPIMIHTLRKMPLNVIPLVLSMAILVRVAANNGLCASVAKCLAQLSHNSIHAAAAVFGLSSTVAANLLNNIPMSVFFVSVIDALPHEIAGAATYASIIGSNLGANITPVAALAGIMWMTILKNHGIRFSFMDFFRYGSIVTLAALTAAVISLMAIM